MCSFIVRALLALALLVPGASFASPDSPSADAVAPLTLAEALARAERQHPLFESRRAGLRGSAARIDQAGQKPAPQIGIEVENVLGSGAVSGVRAAETTLSFSQLIERGGLRDRRVDTAQAEYASAETDAEASRLDVRAEVARRFVHVLSDQAQLAITHEATALAEETAADVERRVKAARSPLAERSRAEISLERAQLEEEHAEHELLSSRRHLAAAIGNVDADFGEAKGDLNQLPKVEDFDALLARVRQTPEFLRIASQARIRDSELRLAQARAVSGITLGGAVRRLEQSDDVGLVFSASMPLFGASRQRSHIAEAEALREQVGADERVAYLKAQAQLYELYQELNHARVEYETQRDRIIPAVERALEQTRYAFDRGRYSLMELRDAQAEWAAQRRRMIEAAASYHGTLIEMQRLSGQAASNAPTVANQ
jgi:cobalt-zinc-cadmium efflux system outer membrane protein